MNNFGFNSNSDTPPIIKNLLIINILMFVLTNLVGADYMINLLGLHYFKSDQFHWWQIITHMFMHAPLNEGGIAHIFFNMFALWMFGRMLEKVWGSKRFLLYYFVTGIGAAIIHTFVNYLMYSHIQAAIIAFNNTPSPELYAALLRKYFEGHYNANLPLLNSWAVDLSNPGSIAMASQQLHSYMTSLIDIPTVGASGAVFGILLGFGMLFPNTELYLLFIPVPIKAKWVVLGYGAIELYQGLTQPGSDIAHFAHLGGMLFGFILIKYWSTKRTNFY